MFKKNSLLLVAGACLSLPLGATTILNTYPDGPTTFTNGFMNEAQTFTAPTDTILSSFEFQMFSQNGGTEQLEIYAWGANGPTGNALYTSGLMSRINLTQNFTVTNIDLALTQGDLYGAVIDTAGSSGENAAFNTNQNSYTGGNMWLLDHGNTIWVAYPGDNLLFQADFIATAPVNPATAPEPGAFLLLGGGLGALALLRRHTDA